jgi:tryptophan-rich sensory protein
MKAFLVLLTAIAFAAAPFFSPEFGGFDPERYPVPQNNPPVQPAGWAFAIWGLIYLGLVVHALYGLLKQKDDFQWESGRFMLFLSLLVGAFWLPVALVSPIWATIMIWIMLITCLASLVQTEYAEPGWIAQWPVALYGGWLTAASFVSIGLLLAGYGIVGEVVAAVIALVLALCFALYFQRRLGIWTYGIAVAWGFSGITAANVESQLVIAVLAGIATIIVLATTATNAKSKLQG